MKTSVRATAAPFLASSYDNDDGDEAELYGVGCFFAVALSQPLVYLYTTCNLFHLSFPSQKILALIYKYIPLGMDLNLAARIPIRPRCSKNDYRSGEKGKNGKGDELPIDWDKAWSSFRKQGKKSFFSQFKSDKYVTWNPRRSEYPLSEEFDPIKRTERSNLTLWTSPKFTLVGAILVVSFLLIYTILSPLK